MQLVADENLNKGDKAKMVGLIDKLVELANPRVLESSSGRHYPSVDFIALATWIEQNYAAKDAKALEANKELIIAELEKLKQTYLNSYDGHEGYGGWYHRGFDMDELAEFIVNALETAKSSGVNVLSQSAQEEFAKEQWRVTREPDDPKALRVSVGGVPGELGYIVYRGDTKECLDVLKKAVSQLEQHYKEQGE